MNYGSYSDEFDLYKEDEPLKILRRGKKLVDKGQLSVEELTGIRPYNGAAHMLYSWAFVSKRRSPAVLRNQDGVVVVDNSNIPSQEEARILFDELVTQEYVAMRPDMPLASNHRQR